MAKKYVLDMFPYPSGAGLHVGHMLGYVATDVICRCMRMKGHEVLHPMGWDAFGLPAENYAIKTGIHPNMSTHDNIDNFRSQLKLLDLSYDWSRELDTSDPNYYKWTQWLFILLFKRGLAYKKKAAANWCPSCETVLANEQVVDGVCERCGATIVQKDMEQWFFKITDYADRLISGLDEIDWLNEVKVQQKNWIGRKVGINIQYPVTPSEEGRAGNTRYTIDVFTTTPVNFGATFLVLAPEHELALKIATKACSKQVEEYIAKAKTETEFERNTQGKEKTGVFTGAYVKNHVTGENIPVWVSDFVLNTVGTGAIQGCPGHDIRDFQFAKKYKIRIPRVVTGPNGESGPIQKEKDVVESGGIMVNSDFLNGLPFAQAMEKTKDYFEKKKWGKRMTTYHLRDWLVSRQRYWGAPIPMIWCQKCADGEKNFWNTSPSNPSPNLGEGRKGEVLSMPGWYPVSVKDLPVLLPTDVDFKPTGESPIARSKSFQKDVVCPVCGGPGRREVDTMDTYVDSSWYFVRFVDPNNDQEIASKEMTRKWLPVDNYVGGGHVVQHLLFARFFYKVMRDAGLIDSGPDEPFLKLRAPGWILGPDSRKMSKRWGNIVTPEEVVAKFGADTLRMYELFMGPFEATKPWNTAGVEGAHRFLGRLERLFDKTYRGQRPGTSENNLLWQVNKLVAKVSRDIESLDFNTAIAMMMKTLNIMGKSSQIQTEVWEKFILVLAPFAPHLAQNLWTKLGKQTLVHQQPWPDYNPDQTLDKTVEIAVQINGKFRDRLTLDFSRAGNSKQVLTKALDSPKIKKYVLGKKYSTVFVPARVINFVLDE